MADLCHPAWAVMDAQEPVAMSYPVLVPNRVARTAYCTAYCTACRAAYCTPCRAADFTAYRGAGCAPHGALYGASCCTPYRTPCCTPYRARYPRAVSQVASGPALASSEQWSAGPCLTFNSPPETFVARSVKPRAASNVPRSAKRAKPVDSARHTSTAVNAVNRADDSGVGRRL